MATMEAVAVRERPILFSGEMVRAILDGRKTQTRRVVKPQPPKEWTEHAEYTEAARWVVNGQWRYANHLIGASGVVALIGACPYGQPGDRLWVRETWAAFEDARGFGTYETLVDYRATTDVPDRRWRPSIHMPRRFSRITLEITDVRVERVQEILSRGAVAEGWPRQTLEDSYDPEILAEIEAMPVERRQMAFRMAPMREDRPPPPKEWFRRLWDELNAPRGYGWDANPWVWVITFRRIES